MGASAGRIGIQSSPRPNRGCDARRLPSPSREVGYGDAYPVTAKGRVVAGFAMIAGIVCVALPTTILAVEFADKSARCGADGQNVSTVEVTFHGKR